MQRLRQTMIALSAAVALTGAMALLGAAPAVIQVAVTLRLNSEDSAAVWNDAGAVAVAVTDAPLLSCPGCSAAVHVPSAPAVVVASRAAASPWPWSSAAGAAR